MRANGGGTIVNTRRAWVRTAAGPASAPTCDESGGSALTRNAALEPHRDGIRINAISPAGGHADVAASRETRPTVRPGCGRAADRPRRPLEEITSAVLWLASAESGFHGPAHDLVLDGGATCDQFSVDTRPCPERVVTPAGPHPVFANRC